jgi:hypothetical protein
VVRAIQHKWHAQSRRAADYRRLFSLAAFIALLLGVLYAQRDASTAFRVHSTLDAVLAPPGDGAMESHDAVYDWLGDVLQVRHRACMARGAGSVCTPANAIDAGHLLQLHERVARLRESSSTETARAPFTQMAAPRSLARPPRVNLYAQAVWRDPVCGDGLCETPFEFASYGRFGCRADCGALINLQQLTSLDIDLYYDFSHQLGSLPAAVSPCKQHA